MSTPALQEPSTPVTPSSRANRVYYFDNGIGEWEGTFTFRVTDWRRFQAAPVGFTNAFLVLAMSAASKLLRRWTIDSVLVDASSATEAAVTNAVRIHRFRVTTYTLHERYLLDEDGRSVRVVSKERFGPISFLFNVDKEHPATIGEDGFSAVYDIPLLGTNWVGTYTVRSDRQHIDSVLQCPWAEAVERIDRVSPIAARPSERFSRLYALVGQLTALRDECEARKDKRAIFAHAYALMTTYLLDDLERKTTKFEDPHWVEGLALAFARRYFLAMDALANGQEAPKPWADVQKAIQGKKSYVLEDLVYSMMAHIGRDLPLALEDVGAQRKNLADYHTMNDVLAGCIKVVQSQSAKRYNRMLASLDRFTGEFDELLTNYGIRMARSLAWYNAERLRDEAARSHAQAAIERSTEKFIDSARKPDSWLLRQLIRISRALLPPRRSWPSTGQRRAS